MTASPATVSRARELHERGRTAMDRHLAMDARRVLKEALTLLDRPESDGLAHERATVRVNVLLTLANAEFELRGLDVAERRLRQAAEVVRAERVPTMGAWVSCQRGLFLYRVGRFAESLPMFEAALVAANNVPDTDPRDVCMVLLNLSCSHIGLGMLDAARDDLRRCRDLARASGVPEFDVMGTYNEGFVEFLAGQLPRALDLMERAFEAGPDIAPGTSLLGMAEVLVEAGLAAEADRVLARAGDIVRREHLARDLGQVELERARCALLLGDVQRAESLAAQARDRFRRRGIDAWQRRAELVLLHAQLTAGRNPARLIAPAMRLRAEFGRSGVSTSARTAALVAAEAELRAGHPDRAAETLRRWCRPRDHTPISVRLHTQYVRARLLHARGRDAAAARVAREALADLARYQASFGSIDLATAAAVHGTRLAALLLAVADRPAAVFAAAEQGRAVSARLLGVRPPADTTTAGLLADLRHTINEARAADRPSADQVRKRRELEERITARTWTRRGSGQVLSVVGALDVQNALADADLVSYSVVAGSLRAVVLDSSDIRLVDLGAIADLDEAVRRVRADLDVLAAPRLPNAMRHAVKSSLRRSLDSLDAALVRPLLLRGCRLVVITTGLLGQLPWPLLPSLRDIPVVVAPSATAWHTAHTRGPSGRRPVVVVAGPDLTRAGDEQSAVAEVWPDADAPAAMTGGQFAAALASAGVVHVAAHGTHRADNPLFSSVRLADGPLFAHELDLASSTPDHVVLSACELGLATVRPGDEALGLTSVLLRLGTRSVVAGIARVGDDVAATAMADYHRRLAAGEDSAAALAAVVAGSDDVVPFVNFGAAYSA